jgi:hypothetical protein
MEATKPTVSNFFQRSRTAKIAAVVAAIAVVLGGIFVVRSFGSGFFASTEAEQGTVTANAKVISDSSASGGKAIQFTAAATTPTTPTTPPPSSGAFPGAYNTGVPHGLPGDTRPKIIDNPKNLPAYTGPMTITQDGTVIDGKKVTGRLVIQAKNVVIKNSYLSNNMGADSENNVVQTKNDSANLLIQDSEIEGINDISGGGTPAVSRTGYTLLRVNVHGSGDLTRIDGRGTIQDSWLHDPQGESSLGNPDGQHHDVIQSTNATYIRILHNTLHNAYNQTSNILLKADIGTISDVIVDGNLMNGGGYTFYWYDGGNYKISNGRVTNNRFMRQAGGGVWPKGGYYGTHAINATTNPTWTNNVWDDTGAQIPL